MIKFIIYVVVAIICGIAINKFGNIEIEPQDIVNSLALIALYESCKNGEKKEGKDENGA